MGKMKTIKQFDLTVEDLALETFPNDGILIPESDYGLAEIYLDADGGYSVGEVPMYGGEVRFKTILTAEEVVTTIRSWT